MLKKGTIDQLALHILDATPDPKCLLVPGFLVKEVSGESFSFFDHGFSNKNKGIASNDSRESFDSKMKQYLCVGLVMEQTELDGIELTNPDLHVFS